MRGLASPAKAKARFKPRVDASPSQRPVVLDGPGPPKRCQATFHTRLTTSSTGIRLPPPSSAGGPNALTVYEMGEGAAVPNPAPTPEVEQPNPGPTPEVEEATPAATPEVEEPTAAPIPEVDEGKYEELGCAVDLTDGVRVRCSDAEPDTHGGDNCNASSTS